MSLLFALAAASQPHGMMLLADNQRFYAQYRTCVFAAAAKFSRLSETTDNIKKASYGSYRQARFDALAKSLENHLRVPAEKLLSNPDAYDDGDQFDQFDAMLEQELTARILEEKLKPNAQN